MTNIAPTASAKSPTLSPAQKQQDQDLRDACVEFEAMLISQLLKTTHANQPEDGLIPRGEGERYFQEMLDGEYGKAISRANPAGIAAMLYQQMKDTASSAASDSAMASALGQAR
ncbi:MAG: rod-binding protein [Armatimonadota bacterium]